MCFLVMKIFMHTRLYITRMCVCVLRLNKANIHMSQLRSEHSISTFESFYVLSLILTCPSHLSVLEALARCLPIYLVQSHPNTFVSIYCEIGWSTGPFPRSIPQQAWASDVSFKNFKAWSLTQNPNIEIDKSWASLVEVGCKGLFLCLFALPLKLLCEVHKHSLTALQNQV